MTHRIGKLLRLSILRKKTYILFALFGGNFITSAQQIITEPNPVFLKEPHNIENLLNNKDVIPKLSLIIATDLSPIIFKKGTNYKGLTVYNTSIKNNLTPGYYFWDGYMWTQAPKTEKIVIKTYQVKS